MASAYTKKEDYDNAKLFFEKSLTEHRTPDTLTKLSEVEKILKGMFFRYYNSFKSRNNCGITNIGTAQRNGWSSYW